MFLKFKKQLSLNQWIILSLVVVMALVGLLMIIKPKTITQNNIKASPTPIVSNLVKHNNDEVGNFNIVGKLNPAPPSVSYKAVSNDDFGSQIARNLGFIDEPTLIQIGGNRDYRYENKSKILLISTTKKPYQFVYKNELDYVESTPPSFDSAEQTIKDFIVKNELISNSYLLRVHKYYYQKSGYGGVKMLDNASGANQTYVSFIVLLNNYPVYFQGDRKTSIEGVVNSKNEIISLSFIEFPNPIEDKKMNTLEPIRVMEKLYKNEGAIISSVANKSFEGAPPANLSTMLIKKVESVLLMTKDSDLLVPGYVFTGSTKPNSVGITYELEVALSAL